MAPSWPSWPPPPAFLRLPYTFLKPPITVGVPTPKPPWATLLPLWSRAGCPAGTTLDSGAVLVGMLGGWELCAHLALPGPSLHRILQTCPWQHPPRHPGQGPEQGSPARRGNHRPQTLPLRQPGRPDVPGRGQAGVPRWAEELALQGSQMSSESRMWLQRIRVGSWHRAGPGRAAGCSAAHMRCSWEQL